MALTLNINGRDITPYLRVAHSDGFDPAGAEFEEPQFVGAPAFREGAGFVADAIKNREWTVPLFLKADSVDELHALISDIDRDLERGAEVEFRAKGASESSFFRLERGRLDCDFQHWISSASRLRATLRLWTAPYATTGTHRTVASFTGSGPQSFPATGVLGDANALASLEVRVGSRVASAGRMIAYGAHRSASYAPIHDSSDLVAQSGATVRGASGAIGSQYVAIPVSPTGASGIALTDHLTPPEAYPGRHRVIGVMRSRLSEPITVSARDRFGAPLGPTTFASQLDPNYWGLVDLGEVHVSDTASGLQGVPTQHVEIVAGGRIGRFPPEAIPPAGFGDPSVVASPAFEVNALLYVPLDQSAGIMRTEPGVRVIAADNFNRVASGQDLVNAGQANVGGVWTPGIVGSHIGKILGARFGGYVSPASSAQFNMYALGSGLSERDVTAEARVRIAGNAPSSAASGAEVLLAPQAVADGGAIFAAFARLRLGPSAVHSVSWFENSSTLTLASVGLGASTASALMIGQEMRLVARIEGSEGHIWLATGADLPASPILSASDAFFTRPGFPALGLIGDDNQFPEQPPGGETAAMGPWWFTSRPVPLPGGRSMAPTSGPTC